MFHSCQKPVKTAKKGSAFLHCLLLWSVQYWYMPLKTSAVLPESVTRSSE